SPSLGTGMTNTPQKMAQVSEPRGRIECSVRPATQIRIRLCNIHARVATTISGRFHSCVHSLRYSSIVAKPEQDAIGRIAAPVGRASRTGHDLKALWVIPRGLAVLFRPEYSESERRSRSREPVGSAADGVGSGHGER